MDCTPPLPPPQPDAAASAFVERWRAADGSERANYQLFIGELCTLSPEAKAAKHVFYYWLCIQAPDPR